MVRLYRYTDKVTGRERGICYSEIPIVNSDWNYSVIQESEKGVYIELMKEQMDEERNTPINLFDEATFLGSLFEVFSSSPNFATLMTCYAPVSDYAKYKNFWGMHDFLKALISKELISQDDYDAVNTQIKLQNLDLDNLPIQP